MQSGECRMHARKQASASFGIAKFLAREPSARWQEMLTRNAGCARPGLPTLVLRGSLHGPPRAPSYGVQLMHEGDHRVPPARSFLNISCQPISEVFVHFACT